MHAARVSSIDELTLLHSITITEQMNLVAIIGKR